MVTVGLRNTVATTLVQATALKSPDGTQEATLSNDGVFTAPGLLRRLGIFLADDYMTPGSGSANAAANSTGFAAAWAACAAAGGGQIKFGSGVYALGPTTLDHQLGYTVGIDIEGMPGSTVFEFHGTTGSFLNISPSSSSGLQKCGITDVYMLHGDIPVSGATIQLGYVSRYTLERIYLMDSGSGLAALTALRMIGSAGGILVANSTLMTRTDKAVLVAAGLTPRTVQFAQTVATGGFQARDVDFSGCFERSNGLHFNQPVLFDTVILTNCGIKDHEACIASGANVGDVANFQMNGGILDGTNYSISINPVSTDAGATAANTAAYYTWDFDGVWMSAEKSNILLSTNNGGDLAGFGFQGCYMTNATEYGVWAQQRVAQLRLVGNRIGASGSAAQAAIHLESLGGVAPSRVLVSSNQVATVAGALACVSVPSTSDPVNVNGNELYGGATSGGVDFGGATSTSRVNANNSWAAA